MSSGSGGGPERRETAEPGAAGPVGHSARGGTFAPPMARPPVVSQGRRARPGAGTGDRAGTAGGGLAERLPDQRGHGGRVGHGGLPLGHRGQQGRLVKCLGGGAAVAVRGEPGGQLAHQGNDGHRGAEGLAQAGRQLRRTRPDRRVAHPGLAGDPGIGVGGVGGRPLVPDQHVPQLGLVVQDGVVQREGLAAGHAEHVPHPVLREQAGQQRPAVAGGRRVSHRGSRAGGPRCRRAQAPRRRRARARGPRQPDDRCPCRTGGPSRAGAAPARRSGPGPRAGRGRG